MAVDNLRLALHCLTDLSAAELVARKDLTARYVETFYNEASTMNAIVHDTVLGATAEFEVTSLNL